MALFSQQCWMWGQDVRRVEGNALIQYGFERHPVPKGIKGSSAYRCDRGPTCTIVLWAFGMWYGHGAADGIYLNRYTFTPVLLPGIIGSALPHRPDQLSGPCEVHTDALRLSILALFQEALGWIAGYETWALATLGCAYRQQCVTSWKHGPFRIAAEQIVPAWQTLAVQSAIS